MIFGTETAAGKWFDLVLIAIIIASVAVIMLDSIVSLDDRFGDLFLRMEWGFTVLFTVEYLIRIWCTRTVGPIFSASTAWSTCCRCCPLPLPAGAPDRPAADHPPAAYPAYLPGTAPAGLLSEANELASALQRSGRKIFVFFSW